jgi:transposase
MLAPNSYRLFVYTGICDMRKGFDRLSGVVRNEMAMDPLSGAMFIFFNRRRTLIKLLIWDTTGFAIYYKRLSRGTFGQFDHDSTRSYHGITRDELLCVLEGIELKTVQKRKRYFHQTHG